MAFVIFLFLSAIQGCLARRHTAHEGLRSSTNLCDRWLMVKYSSIDKSEDAPLAGSFYLLEGEWDNTLLFRKTMSNGCVKSYTAVCAEGGIKVEKDCTSQANGG